MACSMAVVASGLAQYAATADPEMHGHEALLHTCRLLLPGDAAVSTRDSWSVHCDACADTSM
jgi:hypothetical protein